MSLPYVLDKILYAVLNQVSKAFQVKWTWSEEVVAGTVGDYTSADEALALAQASSPASLRLNIFASVVETTTVNEPAVAAGEVMLWKDTTLTKFYLVLGTNGTAAGNKKVELA